MEASKAATAVSKNTFEDLTYVSKSTIGDLTKSAKEVATKKGLLKVAQKNISCNFIYLASIFTSHFCFQSLSESNDEPEGQSSSPPSTSLVQPNILGSGSRDFFSNISSDLNGIADKTTNMFTGLFGMFRNFQNFHINK